MNPSDDKRERHIVQEIWDDICGRSGGDHFLEGCDEEVQQGIRDSWLAIVKTHIAHAYDDYETAYVKGYVQGREDEAEEQEELSLYQAVFGSNQLDINCVFNTLALMVEGEGDDPGVYREMACGAHERLKKFKKDIP